MLIYNNEVKPTRIVSPYESGMKSQNDISFNLTNSDMKSFTDLNKTQHLLQNPDQIVKNEVIGNNIISSSLKNIKFTNSFNLNTFLTIKKSFLSIFKIFYPEDFFNDVYSKKYHSIIGYENGTKELLCFSHIDINKQKKNAKILTLGVVKEYQNNKIGTQLMKKIIEELMIIGIKDISLIVQETNEVAVKLYTKHGFILEKEFF